MEFQNDDQKSLFWVLGAFNEFLGTPLCRRRFEWMLSPLGISEFDQLNMEWAPTNDQIRRAMIRHSASEETADEPGDLEILVQLLIMYRDERENFETALEFIREM